MLVDLEERLQVVQAVRMLGFRGVGEGTEMVFHAQGATAVGVFPSRTIVHLAHGNIHEDVDVPARKVGGAGDRGGIAKGDRRKSAHRCRPAAHHGANLGRISQTDIGGVIVTRRIIAGVVKDDVSGRNPEAH